MKKDFVSLAEARPDLAKEWNYEKNGDLRPEDVSCWLRKKVWWVKYDKSPINGKLMKLEWSASVDARMFGSNNPIKCGKKVLSGYNDLASASPKLSKEWNYERNGNLKPDMVTYGSGKKVWWVQYDKNPITNEIMKLEWEATVVDRFNGSGNPIKTGQKVLKGYNDLAFLNPDLAKEWNYEKNGNLKPEDVNCGSGKKVWWKLPYDVPDDYPIEHLRGRHFDFEWEAIIGNRNKGIGCPYLTGNAVWKGFNDLETLNSQLAKEWHPTKNGNLNPTDVTIGSNKKVWWLLSYDDLETGKHFDFEWQDTVNNRNNGYGCPYLSGKAAWPGFNDLQTVNPELAAQWHPIKNGNLKPTDVTIGSNRKIWWLLPYDDIKTGKHFNFEWQDTITNRIHGYACPYLSGHAVWKGFNDLQTTNPELAKQWHPTKNSNLKPTDVTAGSDKKVWWLLPYDDIRTGKHFDFEWQAKVNNRVNGRMCPYLSGKAVWLGFNDLQTANPELAKQWHPTKNGNLNPTDVTNGSNKKVWWLLSYDDLETGKHFDFEWQDTVNNRNNGYGCPFISGHAVWKGFNDLATVNPELAAQWHPTKNGNLNPTDVTINSEQKVWWILPYDVPNDYSIKFLRGKHFTFEWQATVVNRNKGNGCPYLTGNAVWKGFNDLQTVYPQLAREWHPIKNGNLKPADVTIGSNKMIWWLLPYNDVKTGKYFEFEWKATISSRSKGIANCPFLSGRAVWPGFNDLSTTNPELARQWHPIKNGNLKPSQVVSGSSKKVWWLFPYYDIKTKKHFEFEWKAEIRNRNNGCGCPYLTTYKGEEYIKQYLQKNNISFNTQQKFSDLLGTGDGQLSYDFSIPDEKYGYILIEYNGIQHYEAVDYFGGEEQFKKQKEHDKRKRNYAKKHGYKLITVKYTYDTYESVEEYLDKELKNLGVISDTKKEEPKKEENVNDAA